MVKKIFVITIVGLLLSGFANSSIIMGFVYAGEEQGTSAVGYGLVTSKIKKNVTTQEDIIVLLGAPNITTTDAEGSETWVYDKASTETVQKGKVESEGSRSAKVDVDGQSKEGGVNILIAGYKQGSGHGSGVTNTHGNVSAQDEVTRTTMTKNFTLIIKFNENKTVKNYSVRSANF